jgi:hypothetical protein
MTTLRLAIDLADRAAEAAEEGEILDVRQEAKRLLRRHPEAEHDPEEVAEALSEEAAAAGEFIARNANRSDKPFAEGARRQPSDGYGNK